MALTQDEMERYSRHLTLPEVGVEGQEKLKSAKVLLVGAGGLGSPAAMYLAAAGIGTLGIIDFDVVDLSNLQRQVIHSTQDLDRPKVESAKERIDEINPNVKVLAFNERLSKDNILDLIKDFDVIVDGTDNFQTRYLTNDACCFAKKPLVYGSVFKFDGQVTVFDAHKGPCYRCLFTEAPPEGMVPGCSESGVLGIVPGVIGVLQATEAVKLILGKGESLIGRLLLYDALKMGFREVKFKKNPKCRLCGENPIITELAENYDQSCGCPIRSGKTKINELEDVPQIAPKELKEKMDRKEKFVLIDVREAFEHKIGNIPGSRHIPLATVGERARELSGEDDFVVYCHFGGRSTKAVMLLQKMGFKNVKNLKGGIDAWSQEVDPSCPRY